MGTTIHRDQAGVPTGLATEVFYFLPEFSVDQMKAAIRGQAKELFTDRGTTTIYTIPFSAQDVRADLELQRAGELPLRIRMFYHVPHMTSLEGLLNIGYPSGVGDDMFRFGGMKIFVDGTGGDALGNRYDDVKWTQDELNRLLSSADAAGIQTILHLVTDGGLTMALAAIEETRRRNPKQPYLMHRIEHGGDRRGMEVVRHLRDLGIRLSITPGRGRRGATRPRYKTLVQEQSDPILITDTTGTTPGSSDILFKIACAAVSVEDGGGAPKGEELGFEGALRLLHDRQRALRLRRRRQGIDSGRQAGRLRGAVRRPGRARPEEPVRSESRRDDPRRRDRLSAVMPGGHEMAPTGDECGHWRWRS